MHHFAKIPQLWPAPLFCINCVVLSKLVWLNGDVFFFFLKALTPTWFEHATFWSGVRRATVAPRGPVTQHLWEVHIAPEPPHPPANAAIIKHTQAYVLSFSHTLFYTLLPPLAPSRAPVFVWSLTGTGNLLWYKDTDNGLKRAIVWAYVASVCVCVCDTQRTTTSLFPSPYTVNQISRYLIRLG